MKSIQEDNELLVEYDSNISTESLYSFLNKCYGKWGNINYLDWKYKKIKGVKSKTITIINSNQIIGFRGFFIRNMILNERNTIVGILGDAAISPEFREKKLYGKLISLGIDKISENGGSIVSMFNQKSNITFLRSKRKGWAQIDFPVKVKVYSYNNMFNYYFQKVMQNNEKINKYATRYMDKIELFIEKEQVVFTPNSKVHKLIVVKISRYAFQEIVNSRHQSSFNLMLLGLKLLIARDIKLYIRFKNLIKSI